MRKKVIVIILMLFSIGGALRAETISDTLTAEAKMDVSISQNIDGTYNFITTVTDKSNIGYMNGRIVVESVGLTEDKIIAISEYVKLTYTTETISLLNVVAPQEYISDFNVFWYYSKKHYHPESDENFMRIRMDVPDGVPPSIEVQVPEEWQKQVTFTFQLSDISGINSLVIGEDILNKAATSYIAKKNGDYTIKATDPKGNLATKVVSIRTVDNTSPIITVKFSYN